MSVLRDDSCSAADVRYTRLQLHGGDSGRSANLYLSCGSGSVAALGGPVTSVGSVYSIFLTIPCGGNPFGAGTLCAATNTAAYYTQSPSIMELATEFAQSQVAALPAGTSMNLLLGGHRDAAGQISVAVGSLTTAAAVPMWVSTPDGSYAWLVPSVPSGWQVYAALPGSETLPGASVLGATATSYAAVASLSDPNGLPTLNGALAGISTLLGTDVVLPTSASWVINCAAGVSCPSSYGVHVTLTASSTVGAIALTFLGSAGAPPDVFVTGDGAGMVTGLSWVGTSLTGPVSIVVPVGPVTGSSFLVTLTAPISGGPLQLSSIGVIAPQPIGSPAISVVAPAARDRGELLPPPSLVYNYQPLATIPGISVGWQPALLGVTMPPGPIATGSTLNLFVNGMPHTPAPDELPVNGYISDGNGHTFNVSVPACGAAVTVTAWLSKPGVLSSLVASLQVPYLGSCVATYQLGASALAAVAAGTPAAPFASVIPGLAITLGAGGAGRDHACRALLTIATSWQPYADASVSFVRADWPYNFTLPLIYNVSLPGGAASTFDVGPLSSIIEGTDEPIVMLKVAVAGVPVANYLIGIPPCKIFNTTCNPLTYLACYGLPPWSPPYVGSGCSLQFQQCWSSAKPGWIQDVPAGSACLEGIFVRMDGPSCAAPTPTPTPQPTIPGGSGATQVCNTHTALACEIDSDEAYARVAAGPLHASPCTLSFSECWNGAYTAKRPTPPGSGCLNGEFVGLTSDQCKPLGGLLRRAVASISILADSWIGEAAPRAAATTSVPCGTTGISCPAQCGQSVQWCGNSGLGSITSTPPNTLCFADEVGAVSLIAATDPRCTVPRTACPQVLVQGSAICFDRDLGSAALPHACADAYVLGCGTATVSAPHAVPSGTVCLDGVLVLSSSSACGSSQVGPLAVIVTVSASGLPSYAGPVALGSIASAVAQQLVGISASDVSFVGMNPAPVALGGSGTLSNGIPLPGVPIVAQETSSDSLGVGSTTLIVSVACPMNTDTGCAAFAAALDAAVTVDPNTNISPVTRILASSGSPITISMTLGAAVVAASPSSSPPAVIGASPAASDSSMSTGVIVAATLGSAVVVVAAALVAIVLMRRRAAVVAFDGSVPAKTKEMHTESAASDADPM